MSTIPLYLQIKQKLIERIQSGEFIAGDKLPTENELQEEYKVSRATIRQSLNEIENEEIILRKRGIGTIVQQKKFKKELMRLTSFTNSMISRGMKPHEKIIEVEIIKTPRIVQEYYGDQKSDNSWFIKRILFANDKPIGMQRLYLPTRLMFSPDELAEMQSFYKLISTKHGIKPTYGEETLSASVANKDDALLMQINVGDPLLDIWRTTFDENKIIFEVNHILYIAERYEYNLKLYA